MLQQHFNRVPQQDCYKKKINSARPNISNVSFMNMAQDKAYLIRRSTDVGGGLQSEWRQQSRLERMCGHIHLNIVNSSSAVRIVQHNCYMSLHNSCKHRNNRTIKKTDGTMRLLLATAKQNGPTKSTALNCSLAKRPFEEC
ncbi:hypothetical protein Tcan_01206, partial [Toxocara canis]